MKNRLKPVPSYRLHKQSGQAIVTLTDGMGNRRDVLLGKYDTPESRVEYARVIAEWEAAGRTSRAANAARQGPSVAEVLMAYWRHAQAYYVKDGEPTSQQEKVRRSLALVNELYGQTPAAEFGPLALKAVRERMLSLTCGRCKGVKVTIRKVRKKGAPPLVRTCAHCRGTGVCGWNRRLTNQSIDCVKLAFRWATAEELVPATVHHALQAVENLRAGRSKAREPVPVEPVADAVVDATVPFLTPPVRAMVQFQRLTGARPGEVTQMRPEDIDHSGPVWAYRPGRHKTQHRGKRRTVFIGPKAQAVLAPFLEGRAPGDYVFSPREAVAAWRALQRAERKTPVQPSQQDRRKRKPRRVPGERYTATSYCQAIYRACKRAGVEPWHPHQLRHAAATEIRKEAGLDAAQKILGHATASVTEIYASADAKAAADVMKRIG